MPTISVGGAGGRGTEPSERRVVVFLQATLRVHTQRSASPYLQDAHI